MKAYIDERLVDWYLAYSPKRWRRLLDQFTVLPESAELTIRVWQRSERSGVLVMRPGTGLEVSCGRIDDFPGWLLLSISGSEYGLVGTPEKDEALARVMATIGNACNPAFGAVEFYRSGSTTLESELLRLYQRNPLVGRSKEIVRSYSWIAVISEQAGTALGGVDTLRATGAFHEVTHLGQGGYLLRATRLFHEYTPAHAHRVFHALAPVLPSGMPDAWSRPWEPELIVREDAAEADRCPDRP